MSSVTLRREGNSIGFTVPDETCARMGLEEGQELVLIELADGLKLVRPDAKRDRQMDLARKVLREQADVLRELSQR